MSDYTVISGELYDRIAGVRVGYIDAFGKEVLSGGGGGGTPGGSDTQPQYNNAGAFAGMSGITWVPGTSTYTFGGGVVVNFAGATSGNAQLKAPSVAGTAVITLPGVTCVLATLGANTFTGNQTLAGGTTLSWNGDTPLERVSAGILALRNSTTGQALRIYNTFTDASNGEWLEMSWSANAAYVKSAANGAGTQRTLSISGANGSNVSIGSGSGVITLSAGSGAAVTVGSIVNIVGNSGNVTLGPADAATPAAQTLRAQGSRAGTDSNVGGANLTVQAGTGTGTGTPASLILKSPVLGVSGTAAQVQTNSLTITQGVAVRPPYLVANLPAASAALEGGMAWVTDATLGMAAGYGTVVAGGGANKAPVSCDGTNWRIG